jgi:probable HAF family extracellular repeat protein
MLRRIFKRRREIYTIFLISSLLFTLIAAFPHGFNSHAKDNKDQNNSNKAKKAPEPFPKKVKSRKDTRPKHREDRFILKYKENAKLDEIEKIHSQRGNKVTHTLPELRLQLVEIQSGKRVKEEIDEYKKNDKDIEYVEPDSFVYTQVLPNDTRFQDGSLWGLHNTGQNSGLADADIDAPEGWDTRKSASNTIVAVIDTGIRYTHQDLAANMWKNPGEIAGNNIDDDANGYIDDVYGINTINNTGNPMDDNQHGTHVAGTIGAVGNNGIGVTGVAWNVKLMACKFINEGGSGSTYDAARCIDYAVSKGAKILSNSWGGSEYSQTLYNAINAAKQKDVIFVAAAGNNAFNTDQGVFYPASYELDNVISVAATTRTDELASFSNYGISSVDIAAPGTETLSTGHLSDSDYITLQGTSMATPHVSGALALLREQFPSESYLQLINRLYNSADKKDGLTGKCLTGGRLNLAKALTSTSNRPINDSFLTASTYPVGSCNVAGLNILATKESGEPNHAGNTGGKSLWWKWTSPISGQVTVTTIGSNINTLLGVYTGSSVSSLTTIASNDDDPAGGVTSYTTFTAIAGSSYYVAVDGKNGTEGRIRLTVKSEVPKKSYSVVDIAEYFPSGSVYVNDINDYGQAVGNVYRSITQPDGSSLYDQRAFIWSEAGGITEFSITGAQWLSAEAINNRGEVVGWYTNANGYDRAFLWKNGTLTELGTLSGDNSSSAADINDKGQVVGYSTFIDSESMSSGARPFLWEGGVMKSLGITNAIAYATAINNSGQVVGYKSVQSTDPDLEYSPIVAVTWQDGVAKELDTLTSTSDRSSEARDINDYGQIAGSSITTSGTNHAVVWENGVIKDLFPSDILSSDLSGINSFGHTVGQRDVTPFLHSNSQYVALNDAITLEQCSDLVLSTVTAINSLGQIVGSAYDSDYNSHSLILTPTSPTPRVAITSPYNNASFSSPANITIEAAAADSDGTVSKVEFFNGSTKLGEDTSAPYSFTWSNVAAGNYSITAKVTDNAGLQASSRAVSITVASALNSENFEDGVANGWNVASGTWDIITDGTKVYHTKSTDSLSRSVVGDTVWSNYSVKAKLKVNSWGSSSNRGTGIIARYKDTDNYYLFIYEAGELRIKKKVAGTMSTIGSMTFTFNGSTWYNFEAVLQGPVLKFYVNGKLQLKATDASLTAGKTGLFSVYADARYDDFLVTSLPTFKPSVLFIVASTTLNSGDSAVKSHLEDMGFAVTTKSATSSVTSDANGKSLVLISSTLTSSDVNTKFRDVTVPVMIWESSLCDDMKMTSTVKDTDFGTVSGQTQVVMQTTGHPMSGGLTGTPTVVNASSIFSWGKHNGNAIKIATVVGNTNKAAIFGYEKGASMVGMQAPERRVGFFLEDVTASNLNSNGWKLFDAAVNWAYANQ